MPDEEALARRLRAVERSLTDGDHAVEALCDADALTERVDSLERAVSDVEDRIAETEAATQALRGYVGNVRSVNEDVERRANAALAAVERLEEEREESAPAIASTRRPRERGLAPGRDRSELGGSLLGSDETAADDDGSDEADLLQRVRDVLP